MAQGLPMRNCRTHGGWERVQRLDGAATGGGPFGDQTGASDGPWQPCWMSIERPVTPKMSGEGLRRRVELALRKRKAQTLHFSRTRLWTIWKRTDKRSGGFSHVYTVSVGVLGAV